MQVVFENYQQNMVNSYGHLALIIFVCWIYLKECINYPS